MIVACEALKPPNTDDRYNCYHVIEALLGKTTATALRQHVLPAQWVRSTHLHTGELHGSELVWTAFMSSYVDPTFREAHRGLAHITSDAIVEWIKRQGMFNLPAFKERKTFRRRIRENALIALPIMFCVGLLIGWMLALI
jgi:hypothetical protein